MTKPAELDDLDRMEGGVFTMEYDEYMRRRNRLVALTYSRMALEAKQADRERKARLDARARRLGWTFFAVCLAFAALAFWLGRIGD